MNRIYDHKKRLVIYLIRQKKLSFHSCLHFIPLTMGTWLFPSLMLWNGSLIPLRSYDHFSFYDIFFIHYKSGVSSLIWLFLLLHFINIVRFFISLEIRFLFHSLHSLSSLILQFLPIFSYHYQIIL